MGNKLPSILTIIIFYSVPIVSFVFFIYYLYIFNETNSNVVAEARICRNVCKKSDTVIFCCNLILYVEEIWIFNLPICIPADVEWEKISYICVTN